MTRTTRTLAIAGAAVVALGSAIAVAGSGSHGSKVIEHLIGARIDQTLDQINATPDQRQRVASIEAKLLADVKQNHDARKELMQTLTAQFGQDQMNSTALEQALQPLTQSEDQLRTDVRQAVSDVHDLLTPEQRQKLVSQVKEMQERWER